MFFEPNTVSLRVPAKYDPQADILEFEDVAVRVTYRIWEPHESKTVLDVGRVEQDASQRRLDEKLWTLQEEGEQDGLTHGLLIFRASELSKRARNAEPEKEGALYLTVLHGGRVELTVVGRIRDTLRTMRLLVELDYDLIKR